MAAVDCLLLRERLKEGIRKKMRQEEQPNANSISLSATKLPYNGSFFGPSQPTIAQRVIEESKALLENLSFNSAATSKTEEIIAVKSSKTKAQILKESRNYSFLSSDDNVVPAKPDSSSSQSAMPSSANGPEKLAVVKCSPSKGLEKQSVKLELNKQLVRKNAKGLEAMQTKANGLKPAKSKAHGLRQSKTAAQIQKYARDYSFLTSDSAEPQKSDSSGSKSDITSTASDKQHKPSKRIGSGPVKSSGPKRVPSSLSKKSEDSKKQFAGKSISWPVQSLGPKGGKSLPPVKPILFTKPIQVAEKLGRTNLKEAQHKKRPRECLDADNDVDPEEISRMIRGMFGYNPRKYVRGDRDDDINMEASFRDIQKEERRSAKLAKKEDEEELQKIIEEEKREKMRKKKLKT